MRLLPDSLLPDLRALGRGEPPSAALLGCLQLWADLIAGLAWAEHKAGYVMGQPRTARVEGGL